MVEVGGLENHCTGNRTGGSNPSLSANLFLLIRKELAPFLDVQLRACAGKIKLPLPLERCPFVHVL